MGRRFAPRTALFDAGSPGCDAGRVRFIKQERFFRNKADAS
jgi:hypothetical protein